MSVGPGGSLVVPAGALPALAASVVQAATAVARAQTLLRGVDERVLEAGVGTDPLAAVRAAAAVRELDRELGASVAELVRLARLLGAAEATLDAVEHVLAGALLARLRHEDHLAGALLHLAVRGLDAAVTAAAQYAVVAAPPVASLLADGLGRLLPEGPGDALPLPDQLPGGGRGQTSLAGWLTQVDATGAAAGHIAVTDLGDGQWVVQLPGLHSLLPSADPLDLPGAVKGLTTEHSAYGGAVVVALDRAGVPAGARLLLVGHSQGGIVATRLAADPVVRARWRVTHVVAAGSPVSRLPVPPGTQLLELDNDCDLVTGLDQAGGHDGGGRTVLAFRSEHHDIGGDHDLATTYIPFLAGASATDPRARAFTAGAGGYLRGGPARTQLFALRDSPPPRAVAPGPPLPGALPRPRAGPPLPGPALSGPA